MFNARNLIYLLLVLAASLLVYCNQGPATVDKIAAHKFLNLADSVAYVGMQTCRSCHDNVYQTFIHTGMGRSFDVASRAKTSAKFDEHAIVYDKKSNFYYQPYFEGENFYILEYRLENGDTTHRRVEQIDYIVGSGQHTNSHILSINGYIFQAPITYYTQKGTWDMAPGFEGANLRFSRLLTEECITCHNHLPKQVVGSLNKYEEMPQGIECERCHGPGAIHVKAKLAGEIIDTSKYIDYSIVNPKHLSRDLQMDLCQRCHLQGVSVLEEGKTYFDFKPGMKLSDVMNVYLPRYSHLHEKFIMASQADRLRISPCYLQSEEMSCLTCHNPHHSVATTKKTQYNDACQSCHQNETQKLCIAPLSERAAEDDNCVACHMQKSGSIDIPHVNITDHYISNTTAKKQKQVTEEKKTAIAAFLGLEILTKEKGTPLDMARGYLALYDKYVDHAGMLDSAAWYLQSVKKDSPLKIKTSIHYYFARADYLTITKLAPQATALNIKDAWTNYRIGEAFYRLGEFSAAERYYQQATKSQYYNLDFQEKLGLSYLQNKQIAQAQKTLEFVIAENPKRKVALSNLGYVYVLQAKYEAGEALYDRAIALDPDYEQALMNKLAMLLLKKEITPARKMLQRILVINPANAKAKELLLQLK